MPGETLGLTERLLKRVTVFASVLSLVLFAGVAWNDKAVTLAKAESDGVKTVALFADQAGYLFAVHQHLLEMAAERVKHADWESVEASNSILSELEGLDRLLDNVSEILLVDAQGKVRATTMHRQPDDALLVAERQCFLALSRKEADTCISHPHARSATEKYLFSLSRRLEKEGVFGGVVQVAVSGDYLVGLWASATPAPSDVVTMFEANGIVLAQSGQPLPAEPSSPNWGRFLLGAIGQRSNGVILAPIVLGGPRRITVYAKIADRPIYISMSLDEGAVMAAWHSHLLVYGLVIATAASGLIAALGIAIRQAGNERRAVTLWEAGVEERRYMEEQLRQSQKMEGLGKLTGGIAHDFNNLLTIIIGNIDIATDLAQDARSRRLLAGALKASRSAATLTQRLLAFARKQILEPTAVDLHRLVTGMQNLLRQTLNADVRLLVSGQDGLWPALVDPNQIELAILNLAVNARDAMPHSGTLSINASNRESGPEAPHGLVPGRYVVLTISDTGTGMDEATLARATEPFFSTKPVGKGTGLGLSMIQGFIAQSGGAIRISSRPGCGTQVELWVPRALSDSAPAAECRQEPGKLRDNASILVCDDDPAVLEFVCDALEATGYRVLPASSGQMAISILEQNKNIRLVLADYTMPEMNGADLARKVRAAHPGLPILLITGNTDLEAIRAELPDIDLLGKPFDRTALARRVSAML